MTNVNIECKYRVIESKLELSPLLYYYEAIKIKSIAENQCAILNEVNNQLMECAPRSLMIKYKPFNSVTIKPIKILSYFYLDETANFATYNQSVTQHEMKLIHFVSFIAFLFYGRGEATSKDDTDNLKKKTEKTYF